MIHNKEPRYQAYLLRLWRSRSGAGWRVSLQPAGSREELHFSSIEKLAAFLDQRAAQQDMDPRQGTDKKDSA